MADDYYTQSPPHRAPSKQASKEKARDRRHQAVSDCGSLGSFVIIYSPHRTVGEAVYDTCMTADELMAERIARSGRGARCNARVRSANVQTCQHRSHHARHAHSSCLFITHYRSASLSQAIIVNYSISVVSVSAIMPPIIIYTEDGWCAVADLALLFARSSFLYHSPYRSARPLASSLWWFSSPPFTPSPPFHHGRVIDDERRPNQPSLQAGLMNECAVNSDHPAFKNYR